MDTKRHEKFKIPSLADRSLYQARSWPIRRVTFPDKDLNRDQSQNDDN